MKKTASLLALATALALGGCASLHTPYTAPATSAPAQWAHAGTTAQPAADSTVPWWHGFNDPQLNTLISTALERNNDLAAAAWRVRQARLQADMAASDLLPTPSASLSSGASRPLDGGNRSTSRSSSASLGLSYEADLWGRLAQTRNAQQWEAEATQQDRQATALALAGTTASLYWQIAYLNERLAHADQSLAYTQRTLALVQAQYRAGSVSALELREAEASLASQTASRTQLVQQRVEARNALAILFDAAPGDAVLASVLPPGVWAAGGVDRENGPQRGQFLPDSQAHSPAMGQEAGEKWTAAAHLQPTSLLPSTLLEPQRLPTSALPTVAAGLPAELLARRPDLRAAELRLRETLATGDASRASYYPALTLTGAVGTSSTELLNLLKNPVATLGAGLTLPFLRFNEMKLNTERVKAQYAEAATSFRQTLYTAMSEVENALSARTQYALQGEALAAQLQASTAAEQLYQTRYRLGAATLQVWLDAQEKRRSAELAVSANRLDQLNAQVTLYKALGGDAAADALAEQTQARAP